MTNQTCTKVELLAPAGNLEKLEIAINYGADAVYLAGKNFNLRNFSDNFSLKNMHIARALTSKHNVKMYIAVNTYSRNREYTAIGKYLHDLEEIKPDGIIIADPSIFTQAKELIPEIPIHISTQSNTTNTHTALFWENLGAKRINAARELTLEEIQGIASNTKIEIETFVHGAMCIAYSGRCLMSNFMSQRESNQGMCCQPCRFNYTVMEAKRPGEYFPVCEDNQGSYVFSSKDLCMIEHVPALINAGVKSLKIEGRMKSINYVATTTKIYREAIDSYYNTSESKNKLLLKRWSTQLNSLNNRGYCTGFFFNDPNQITLNPSGEFNSERVFIAKVICSTVSGKTLINVRNKIFSGDDILIMTPWSSSEKKDKIKRITARDGIELPFAQPNSNVYIHIESTCKPLDLIHKTFRE